MIRPTVAVVDGRLPAELFKLHVEGRYEVAFLIDDRNSIVRM